MKSIKHLLSLFDSYAITGGLSKYLEMQAKNKSLTHRKMLDFILKPHKLPRTQIMKITYRTVYPDKSGHWKIEANHA